MSAANRDGLLKSPEAVTAHCKDIQTDLAILYSQHIAEKMSRYQMILAKTGCSDLYIASGQGKRQFQDDLLYPFNANTYFREWSPLNTRTLPAIKGLIYTHRGESNTHH